MRMRASNDLRCAAQQRCHVPKRNTAVDRVPDALADRVPRDDPNLAHGIGLIRIETVRGGGRARTAADVGFSAEGAGARVIDHAVGPGVITLDVAGGDRRRVSSVDLRSSERLSLLGQEITNDQLRPKVGESKGFVINSWRADDEAIEFVAVQLSKREALPAAG